MPRRLAHRLAAIVLFAAFVVGGGGVALLDIALFHSGSAQHVRNMAATDAPRTTHHACVLGAALPGSLPTRVAPMALAVRLGAAAVAVRLPDVPLASTAVHSPQQSRAPPTALI